MNRTEYLVAYDIADPHRLRRVAKLMLRYGVRVQKSVFECALPAAATDQMLASARDLIDPAEDGVRVYPLLADARNKAILLGNGGAGPDASLAVVV